LDDRFDTVTVIAAAASFEGKTAGCDVLARAGTEKRPVTKTS
jgi:hypothetical protein